MQKSNIINSVYGATIALFIPFIGNIFVNGWNWGLGDFIFAWVFFIVLGLTYTYVTHKIVHRIGKVVAGIVVVLCFAAVWVMLATG